MVVDLAARLGTLVSRGQPLNFTTIDMPVADVINASGEIAGGPMAPLLAEVICSTNAGDQWVEAVAAFIPGMGEQTSVLHLSTTLDVLLSCPERVRPHSTALLDVLLSRFGATVKDAPLLAGTRLNAAVRLAIGRAVSPYRIWECLDQLTLFDAPNEFVELMPRTIGAALDTWAAEPTVASTLRRLLGELSQVDVSSADAAYEIGCDRLRMALSKTDLAEITERIGDARRYLVASTTEEARVDATCLIAACDAVLAFGQFDSAAIKATATRIEHALSQRAAWELRTYQPQWTRPRRSAEIAWSQLILLLDNAAGVLSDEVWMNPWAALDAVFSAYSASRTVQPLGAGAGLSVLIKPAIEDAFLREQNFLRILERAAQDPDQDSNPTTIDVPTAHLVLANIRARHRRTLPQSSNADESSDGEPHDPERLYRLAPMLARAVGMEEAMGLEAVLNDSDLVAVGKLAEQADHGRTAADDPVVTPILDSIIMELSEHPKFTGRTRTNFIAVTHQIVLFLKSRMDLTTASLVGKGMDGKAAYDYRRRPDKGQRKALEADLQRDFHTWLQAGPLQSAVSSEPIDIGLGRGDIILRFGAMRFLVEIKRDEKDCSKAKIESTYLTQAAEYGNTNVPFGALLILDLTDKKSRDGTRRLDELVWVATSRPSDAVTDRSVIVGVLPGNRPTPSDYSK